MMKRDASLDERRSIIGCKEMYHLMQADALLDAERCITGFREMHHCVIKGYASLDAGRCIWMQADASLDGGRCITGCREIHHCLMKGDASLDAGGCRRMHHWMQGQLDMHHWDAGTIGHASLDAGTYITGMQGNITECRAGRRIIRCSIDAYLDPDTSSTVV